ncbi:WD40/YVTN/BNR-like repeat-containing protein [Dongia sp.]|uniref:WD40/YVTN/BNR-like repeat-containing protein n=1 Tax=Dongia sp. TaxID=1977262 RepID=UPI003752AD96
MAIGLVALCGLMVAMGVVAAFIQPPRPDPIERGLFDSLLWPRERNVFARLPVIDVHLNDLAMTPDAARAWAVGEHGTILVSDDLGHSWTAQASGTDADLYGIQMLPEGSCGWIVGDAGTILKTADGGRTWQPQASGTQQRLIDVTVLGDCRRGWIRGLHNTWLMTRDGAQWNQTAGYVPPKSDTVSPEEAESIRRKVMHEAEASWAASATKALPRETFSARIAVAEDLRHGILIDLWGLIRFSEDGGEHWQATANPLAASLAAAAISADGRYALAVGSYGAVIASRDGGRTWFPQSRGHAEIADIALEPGTKAGWAIAGAYLLKTSDGGGTWLIQAAGRSPATDSELKTIQIGADGKHLWIASRDDVFRSEDGGMSWLGSERPPPFWVHDLAMLADGRGWAVGGESGGWVSETQDSGRTWTGPVHETGFRLRAVAVSPDGRRIFASGAGSAIVSSEDGGQSWRETGVALSRLTSLQDAVFDRQGRRALAVGMSGTLLITTDGGASSTITNTRPDAALTDIALSADDSGWIGGSGGALFQIEDLGNRWQQLPAPFQANVTAVAVTPGGFGIAGGADLTLAHTEDGGRSWQAPEYRRDPAPWTYAWLLFWSSLGIWFWWRRRA